MSEDARKFLELLAKINQLETRCKLISAPKAVPPEVYKLFDQLRAKLSKWGIECFVDQGDDR